MFKLRIALLLVAALAGCALFQPKPPEVNLYGRRRVAVLPFGNASGDSRLAATFETAVVGQLRALHACPIAGPAEAAAAGATLFGGGIPAAAERERTAKLLACDLLLIGSVVRYTEDVKTDPPKRIRAVAGESAWKWGRGESCRVAVAASVTLLDAATGAVVKTRSAEASRALGRWTDLAWPGDQDKPPAAGVGVDAGGFSGAADRNVARARDEAVEAAVRDLLSDERGAPGWEPPEPPK